MHRREVLGVLGGSALCWPLAASAQQSGVPVIGFLGTSSPRGIAHGVAGFHQGLKEEGFVEKENVTVEYRWAEGQTDRLPALAADLVKRNVAAIASFGPPALQAARAATSIIPIVFTTGGDVVKAGIVASLNRPGGNITGVNLFTQAATPKRLELMDKLVPPPAKIGFLLNPRNPAATGTTQAVQQAATALKRQLVVLHATTDKDVDAAFEALARDKIGGLVVNTDQIYDESLLHQIIALAARHAIPAIYGQRAYVVNGGLISYGTSIVDAYRQVGNYVGRILKGERPGNLPVIQPSKFEFAINLKTAKTLGLDIPPTLLIFADETIE